MSLSNQTIQDKNALATDAVFLVLLELNIPNTPPVYLVNNTEGIVWKGNNYISFPFELEDINRNKNGEIPEFVLKISNASRVIERYLQEYDLYLKQNGIDGNAIEAVIRIVNTNDLSNPTPIQELKATLSQPSTNPQWATFKFRPSSPYTKQFPSRRAIKNFCGWKFKSNECGYSGEESECNKTLSRCRELGNSSRFGGFPGVGAGGVIQI